MCMVLYASADFELPLVPWTKHAPAFASVEPRQRGFSRKRKILPGECVRELVTAEGCGCRFIIDERDWDTNAETVQATSDLMSYLTSALQRGDVDLLALWLGDEGKEPARLGKVSPRSLTFVDVSRRPQLMHVTGSIDE